MTREVAHYFLRSFSLMVGIPANNFLRDIIESLNTMKRPPMTERLRRKNVISKIRPSKPLNNDDCEKTTDGVFRVALRHHCTRGDEHSLFK